MGMSEDKCKNIQRATRVPDLSNWYPKLARMLTVLGQQGYLALVIE